jgi:hypothetical protein
VKRSISIESKRQDTLMEDQRSMAKSRKVNGGSLRVDGRPSQTPGQE